MQNLRRLMPILNALLVFDEAGRQNSFTRAGKILGMAQPSVSRFVANLENHLGAALFERKHNRLRLTAQGERLHRAVTSGLGEIQAACTEIETAAEPPVLSIECTHGFAYMWLMPRLQSLIDILPGWRVRTINSDARLSSDADLVVRIGDGDWPNEDSLLLFDEEVFPVASPEFISRHRLDQPGLGPQRLIDLPLICEDLGDREWMGWSDWFAHFGIDFRLGEDVRPLHNYALVLQAAMEGKGLALAWSQLDEPHLGNGWLVELEGFRVNTRQGYYLCYPASHPLAGRLAEWVDSLRGDGPA